MSDVKENRYVRLLKDFGRNFSSHIFIWSVGFFEYSSVWIIVYSAMVIWRREYQKKRARRRQLAINIGEDENETILARIDELPAWVFFPDVERAEWLNEMIKQMWPFIVVYGKKVILETVQPILQSNTAKSIHFTHIDLGDMPPRIGGIKIYRENTRRNEIILDMEVMFASDSRFQLTLGHMNVGVNNLHVSGQIRCILSPLISRIPMFGAIKLFFLENPIIDYDLTKCASIFDVPGIGDMIRNMVVNTISSLFVLPNRFIYPIIEDVDINELKFSLIDGIIRIDIIEGSDLPETDILLSRHTDAFCVMNIGQQEFQTKVIKSSLNPKWNETFFAIVDDMNGQVINIDILDKDFDKNEDIGNCQIDVRRLASEKIIDSWYTLEFARSGRLHIRTIWCDLLTIIPHPTINYPYSSILMVFVDSCESLPMTKKNGHRYEPCIFCSMTMGGKNETTNVVMNTTNPKFEKNFQFLVENAEAEQLHIDIIETKGDKKQFGFIDIALMDIIRCDEMKLERSFPINTNRGSMKDGKIHLKMILRGIQQTNIVRLNSFNNDTISSNQSLIDDKLIIDELDENMKRSLSLEEKSTIVEKKSSMDEERSKIDEIINNPNGVVNFSMYYAAASNRFIVRIHECRNLPFAHDDDEELPDAFIKIYLQPGKEYSDRKCTKIHQDNISPKFNEMFEWNLSLEQLSNKRVVMSVRNEKSIFSTQKKVLGVMEESLFKFRTQLTYDNLWRRLENE
ncbi:hypothetical protein SNEBB_011391 [Seison nebaliae]|nr:hypothetical protein SNEBB_011391 [Seison nebaliae]